jgi:hypothetical protein
MRGASGMVTTLPPWRVIVSVRAPESLDRMIEVKLCYDQDADFAWHEIALSSTP